MDIRKLTIKDVQGLMGRRETSAAELRQQFLNLIKKEDKKLKAFLSVDTDADAKAATEESGELAGVPLAVKDNICVRGTITTAGSKILKNYRAVYDATAAAKIKEAGALVIGKTNLDEFAMGSSTENSAFGPTKNPHDLSRVPGGSSGGSAAAVASGMAVAALGSDTGGSIRQPAAFCGVVGLKPTYGRVSRYGLIAMASSLDQIGPLTKNVYDAALMLKIISGRDDRDSTTADQPVPDFTADIAKSVKGIKLALPREYFGEGLDSQVGNLIEKAVTQLEKLGAHISQVNLPHTKYALPTYYILMPSEVSSNLARYDGLRYGQPGSGRSLQEDYLTARGKGLGAEARRRIILGTYTLSAGYYDAYYRRAQKTRALIIQDFETVFRHFDAILGPTAPAPAFKIGEKKDPLSMYLSDVYTVSANLAGLPAVSLPVGKTAAGLPVGLQIIGRRFDEAKILQIAYNLEQDVAGTK